MTDCYQCGSPLDRDVATTYNNGGERRHLECYTCPDCGAKGHTITSSDGRVTGRQGPACQRPAAERNPEVEA